ncbi:MAG: peptide chain release factor 2 [Saprospiraceae bacterium]|nr:peptide chain release factor 2 [Bacteroidia bacterium]NNL93313.1 peptide chain release factor 2 [Saprospiraceae bacterium]
MTIEQYKALQDRVASLRSYLDVDKRLNIIKDKEQQSADPEFWNNPKTAQVVMKEIRENKLWVNKFSIITDAMDDLEVLSEFYSEGESSEEDVEKQYQKALTIVEDVEFRSTLDQEEDILSCLLEINAGAGGTEACDWAEMLYRMYVMYGEKAGYKVKELNRVQGDVAGVKSVELELSGDYAYGMLKSENGVHRLVRVSPFNAQGKRMTSFASVFVHPVVDDSIEIDVNPADLDWDTFRASGAGGQHVNKTESAVRVRHLPSGVVVECQAERSQHMNREKAIEMLKSRLYERALEEKRKAKSETESQKMKNEWGSQIRSYVLDDRRVKDHRTNFENRNTDAVLSGDLDGFLKAYLMWNP